MLTFSKVQILIICFLPWPISVTQAIITTGHPIFMICHNIINHIILLSDTYVIIKQIIYYYQTTHVIIKHLIYYQPFNLLFLNFIQYQPSLIVAQLVEHSLSTHQGPGSSPAWGNKFLAFFVVFKDGDLEYDIPFWLLILPCMKRYFLGKKLHLNQKVYFLK